MPPIVWRLRKQFLDLKYQGPLCQQTMRHNVKLYCTFELLHSFFQGSPVTFGCKPKLPPWLGWDYAIYENTMEYLMLLHDHSSLPMAEKDSVSFHFKYDDILKIEFEHHYIRKSELSLVSTKETPCSSYHLEICKDIEINEMIKNDFNCTIPIFSSGGHLNMNESLSECNNQVILEALRFRRIYTTDCPSHPPCDSTRYLSRSIQKHPWGNRFELIFLLGRVGI